jgi:hypothetical protein
MLRSNAATRRNDALEAKKFHRGSLLSKRASLSGKFPISERDTDMSEE